MVSSRFNLCRNQQIGLNSMNNKVCVMEELSLCECGCGLRVTKPGNRFIIGHNQRGILQPPRTPEHCTAISRGHRNSDAVKAHNDRMRGVPRSQEVRSSISKGLQESDSLKAFHKRLRGVPRSPEIKSAISEANRNSDANKAQIESMRGGNDLVDHHYIYDHDDLSKYTMKVTRSKHGKIHAWMKKANIIVPHINIKEI